MSKHHLDAAHPLGLTSDVKLTALDDFRRELVERSPDVYEFLTSIANYAPKIPAMERISTPPITAEALGTLMIAALGLPGITVPATPGRVRELKHEIVLECCNLAYSLRSSEELSSMRGSTATERVLHDFPVTLGTQAALSSDPLSGIGRFAVISGFHRVPCMDYTDQDVIENAMIEHFDEGLREVALGAFLAWTVASRNTIFHLPTLFQHFDDTNVFTGAFRSLLKHTAISLKGAHDILAGSLGPLPPLAQAFALFTAHPFVELGRDWFLCAPHPYTRLFMSQRLFTAPRTAAATTLPSGHGPHDNKLSRLLGDRFENYAFEICRQALVHYEAIPEQGYIAKANNKSPDGVFLSASGKDCVLMQSKLRFPGRGLILGDPEEDSEQDYHHVYARMLQQNVKFLIALEEAHAKGRIRPTYSTVAERILTASRWTFLCLCPVIPQVMHLPQFRRKIQEAVKTRFSDSQYQWYSRHRNRGRITTVHIDGVETIEYFGGTWPDLDLPGKLRTWNRAVNAELTRIRTKPSIPASFSNYMKARGKWRRAERLRFLHEAFELLGQDINRAAVGDQKAADRPSEQQEAADS